MALSRTLIPAFAVSTVGARSINARSFLQTSDAAADTPVTRVVNLLKEMSSTLEKDMAEDEGLYDKLKCWCRTSSGEKGTAIEDGKAKIAELESTIESLTSRTAGELTAQIKELEEQVAEDKAALGEASGLREKQLQEFQNMEDDSIQAIESAKAALTVLSKHQDDAFPQLSFLQSWTESHKAADGEHALDEFMQQNDIFDTLGDDVIASKTRSLRRTAPHVALAQTSSGWSSDDVAVVHGALRTARAFMQTRHGDSYMPGYESKSGEIVGVLSTMKEEMQAELSEAQKKEQERAGAFSELKAAKTTEIEDGEAMAEKKEDELANGGNALAEAKEDLKQEQVALGEAENFSKNLEKTCGEADAAFAVRKKARLEEIKAVAETIEILTADEARDNLSKSMPSFVQVTSHSSSRARAKAAASLRVAARSFGDADLALLATSVELDSFGKVKKAIDDMITVLKTQQADEVKKADYCKEELQESEMDTAKTTDRQADLQTKEAELQSNVKTLDQGIADAQASVSEMQTNLQRASEDRKAANLAFQTTISDQAITVEILKKALDKLATFYDKDDSLLQVHSSRQTPPVPQAEYKPNSGSSGVMQMIEKLIQDAETMTTDAKAAEVEEQAAYEQTVQDTNDSVAALEKEVVSKSKAKNKAKKDLQVTGQSLIEVMKELEGLSKANADLHGECDYVLKNFEVRQKARGDEVEALQQAKSVLNGADLS